MGLCRFLSLLHVYVPVELIDSAADSHGGAITTAFDNLTSSALFLTAREGVFKLAGVSRSMFPVHCSAVVSGWLISQLLDLNVTFLRPAPIGTVVTIECSVLSMGKRLALVRGEMRRKTDGALVAYCMHDKANTDPGSGGKL